MTHCSRTPPSVWISGVLAALWLASAAGCAASKAPMRAEPTAAPPAGEAVAAEQPPPPADDASSDRGVEEKKEKSAEEPSLHQPPAEDTLGPPPSGAPSEDDEVEWLEREERQFQKAIDPEALSCAGALPRRDAICSLAQKICELSTPTSLSAQKDCEKAQSACTNAKATYRSRCGG